MATFCAAKLRLVSAVSCLFCLTGFGALTGCGNISSPFSGGSGGGGGASPDFSLSVSPATIMVTVGQTGTSTLTLVGSNGFSGTVSLQVSGLPNGVTSSLSNTQITVATPTVITFSASGSSTAGSSTVTVTGVNGSLSHTVQVGLTIEAPPAHASMGRTKYVRTDSVTEYGGAINSEWVVYHAVTNRFFVADPAYNRIVVMNAATETEVGTIAVPGAYGIDLTPDGSVLYAGTQVGDVYAIDPVAMTVTHRYIASGIGPYGYAALTVHVLADGDLVLLGSAGGIPAVDGSGSFAIWNFESNSLSVYTTGYGSIDFLGSKQPYTVICGQLENIAAFTISGDRTAVLLGSADSDATICSFNSVTKQAVTTTGGGEFIFHLVATPDGKSVLQSNQQASEVAVLDSKTLAVKGNIPVVATSSATTIAVSADSSTMYLNNGDAIYAYDIATGAATGWMPGITVEPLAGGFGIGFEPVIQAVDGTGLLVGPMEEGVGFIDTTAIQTGPVGSLFLNSYLTPATGPATGGTSVEWEGSYTGKGTLEAVDFGTNPASSVVMKSGEFLANTPAGTAGPVDVYSYMADGGVQIVPEGFSYGPTLLEATVDASTAEGGGTGWVYGYGFGSTEDNATIPTNLQVTIGGTPVTVTAYEPNAYGTSSPPFPLQAFSYTIPAGVAAASANITVTTPSGTATLKNAVTYLPAVQQYPLAGAALAQGIYDPNTSLYYFTDAGVIQVFSRTQGKWLTPIAVPVAPAGVAHRLWGIALSQDGTKLAVSDWNTEMIYVLNPATGAAQSFSVPKALPGLLYLPAGLAVSNAGMVYFTMGDYGGTGFQGFYKLNTATGAVLNYGVDNPGLGYTDLQLRAAILADQSEVIFNNDGQIFSVNTATDKVTYKVGGSGCCYGDYDLTLAAGQGAIEATGVLFDGSLNESAPLVLNDRESTNISYVYGVKLSADGTLLFQPSTSGIDVFDGRLGTLRQRIDLPVALSQNFDALVSDGQDNVLVAITGKTGTGVAIVDLSNLAEPPALPYVRASPEAGLHYDSPRSGPAVRALGARASMKAFEVDHVTGMAPSEANR